MDVRDPVQTVKNKKYTHNKFPYFMFQYFFKYAHKTDSGAATAPI